jgi:hypothetical protein
MLFLRVALPTYILQVPSSNAGRNTDYSDWLSSVPPLKFQDSVLHYARTASVNILSSSPLPNNPSFIN